MKTSLVVLVVATAVALGAAASAQAAPLQGVSLPVHAGHGHWGVGVGVGLSGGGYAPAPPPPAGYYRTEIRYVPVQQFAGYDIYGRPVYTTTYVQQAYQVWVPTPTYVAPRYYAPSYGPRWSVGVGFGYRWR